MQTGEIFAESYKTWTAPQSTVVRSQTILENYTHEKQIQFDSSPYLNTHAI